MGEVDLGRACEAVWVAGQQQDWISLVVVPAAGGLAAVAFARELARVGSDYYARTVEFIDGTGISVSAARPVVEKMTASKESRSLIVALDDPLESQAALLIARAASRVVLAVTLGESKLLPSRRLVEALGKERFLGAVVA